MKKRVISLVLAMALSMSMLMLVGCNDAEKKLQKQIDDLNAILTEQAGKITELENDKQELADLYEELQNKNTEQAGKIEELQNENTEQVGKIEDLQEIIKTQKEVQAEIDKADKNQIVQYFTRTSGDPGITVSRGYMSYKEFNDIENVVIRLALGTRSSFSCGYDGGLYLSSGYEKDYQYYHHDNQIQIKTIIGFGTSFKYMCQDDPQNIYDYNYSEKFWIPKELFCDKSGFIIFRFIAKENYEYNPSRYDLDLWIPYKIEDNKVIIGE